MAFAGIAGLLLHLCTVLIKTNETPALFDF